MTATAPTCQRQHPAVCCANFLSMCLHGRRYRASTCHALTLLLSTLVTMRSCDLINAYLFSSFSLLITSNWNAFLNSYFSLYIQRYFVYTLNVCVYVCALVCQLSIALFTISFEGFCDLSQNRECAPIIISQLRKLRLSQSSKAMPPVCNLCVCQLKRIFDFHANRMPGEALQLVLMALWF